MLEFIKWYISTEFTKDKIAVWLQFFKNGITLLFVCAYIYMMIKGYTVASHFQMIMGIIIGFYFKQDTTKDEPREDEGDK